MAAVSLCPQIQSLDEPSASLIIQLQLEDLGNVVSNFKGKSRAGCLNDEEYSFQLCQEELEAWQSILRDREMGQSILRAQRADDRIISQVLQEEEIALADRCLAAELEGRNVSELNVSKPQVSMKSIPRVDPEYEAKLTAIYHSEETGTALSQKASGSKRKRSTPEPEENDPQKRRDITRPCEVCQEDRRFFDLARLPCNHEFCRDCVDHLFRRSVEDESLFPPRCCQQRIPFSSVRIFLGPETARSYKEKEPELETPNRSYCHKAKCSAWIPPRNTKGDIGTCPKCATRTCIICKGAAHKRDCPQDEGTNQVLKVAAVNGWRRCHNCGSVIQLSFGCNHVR
ncbi:ibr finger domain-containing protein [Phyllosticta citrichinensis]|uniref:RBR-type E3 ubiquitin transferase n=1 Tax=Phyllosticta citrichinensis TaxID=1130410 RepID=A0ABR1Y289_9PEZI